MCVRRPHEHRGRMARDSQLENNLVYSDRLQSMLTLGEGGVCWCTISWSWSQSLKSSLCPLASDQLRDKLTLAQGTTKGVSPEADGKFAFAWKTVPEVHCSCQLGQGRHCCGCW